MAAPLPLISLTLARKVGRTSHHTTQERPIRCRARQCGRRTTSRPRRKRGRTPSTGGEGLDASADTNAFTTCRAVHVCAWAKDPSTLCSLLFGQSPLHHTHKRDRRWPKTIKDVRTVIGSFCATCSLHQRQLRFHDGAHAHNFATCTTSGLVLSTCAILDLVWNSLALPTSEPRTVLDPVVTRPQPATANARGISASSCSTCLRFRASSVVRTVIGVSAYETASKNKRERPWSRLMHALPKR